MRPGVVTTFHDTVGFCFNSVLEMTGTSVRDPIYERLETVVLILTDATASQAVAKSCLVNTSTHSSANNVQLTAATFTAITLQIGDTIQITWSIPWT